MILPSDTTVNRSALAKSINSLLRGRGRRGIGLSRRRRRWRVEMLKVLVREMRGGWSTEKAGSYGFEIRITNLRMMRRVVRWRRWPEKVLKLRDGGGEDRKISRNRIGIRIRIRMEERKRVGMIRKREGKPI